MIAASLLMLLTTGRVQATNHLLHIEEVMVGANGNSKIQFIVVKQQSPGQNLWGPINGIQSAAMLVFFDASGRETGKFKFPANPPTGGTLRTLIATQEFANIPGAPPPDVIIPPLLNPIAGKLCFRNNGTNSNFTRNDCISYGGSLFTGNPEGGPVGPALPIMNTVSLRRSSPTSGVTLSTPQAPPTPNNIAGAGATFVIPVQSQVVQGENLFNNETFQGNGRTCASCHVQSEGFRFPPNNVQARFATLASTFDPQFIAETSATGFDFNLNVLDLTAEVASNRPCTGELRGIITGGGGRAKVLTRVSPTRYLIYGGVNPPLSGLVSDSFSCSGTVAAITEGDLKNLESPQRMRTSRSESFPQGRALILENIDGFSNPPVFRKSPHLLNLSRTAPFGFSGDIPDLRVFTTGAVRQHFPRTLARAESGSNPDFRLPTTEELAAMEEFLRAQEFPSGSDTGKFNLDRFISTPAEQRGRDAFFGDAAKCSQCHGGLVLAETTVNILGQGTGVNGNFNTGVVNQLINSSSVDNLPCAPTVGAACGSRRFSTPPLFNLKRLGPFFHDASAPTVRDAVDFYNSSAFNNSEAGQAIGGITMTAEMVNDITAFLEGLTIGSISANSSTNVTGSTGGAAAPLPSVVVRDRLGNPQQGVPVTFALAGQGSLVGATQTTDESGVATLGNWILGAGPATVTATAAGDFFDNPVAFQAIPRPTLTNLSPNGVTRGTVPVNITVTLTGTNFIAGSTTVNISGNGITITSATVASATSITANLTIAAEADFGARSVTVTTPGGTTAALTFTVLPSAPSLTSISPNSGSVGTVVSVTFTGANFLAGFTTIVVSGTGVTASNINVISSTSMTASFTIASNAAVVDRFVTVNNGGAGSASQIFRVLPPPPTLTSISPQSGRQNTNVPVSLAGDGFIAGVSAVVVSGTGVTVSGTNVISPTAMTAIFNIAPNAPLGVRNVTVTNAGAASSAVTFAVTLGVPVITSVSPAFGVRGHSGTVTITGSSFDPGGTTIAVSGAGVAVSDIDVAPSGGQMTAVFDVAPDAALGTRTITVTNAIGTSAPVNFNIFDPFPDLRITSAHAANLAAGFNETYTISVANDGRAASSSMVTVTDTLPASLSFVSAAGAGWACSAAGLTVTCQRSSPLAPGASTAITLTVLVNPNASGTITHTAAVNSLEDLNPANNTVTDPANVVTAPLPAMSLSPSTILTAGQQSSVNLTISAPFPREFGGTLTMSFTSNAAIPVDDPAIQFATGGRQVSYTFPANSTVARFTGVTSSGPIGFQAGTVAGAFAFSGTMTAGVTQRNLNTVNATLPQQPPRIQSMQVSGNSEDFTAAITLLATHREVNQMTLLFGTTPSVKLNCGSLPGCTTSGTSITFNVKPIFDAWFAADKTFGSLTTMRLPFTIRGASVRGTITVTLLNSRGPSPPAVITIP